MLGEVRHCRFCPRCPRPEADDGLAHGHAPPIGSAPINLVFAPLGRRAASYIFGCLLDHVLREIHYPAEICISLIKLQHGELRIPTPTEPLIAEVTIDFVHSIEPADGKPLEIKLRRDTQK